MALRANELDGPLAKLQHLLGGLAPSPAMKVAVERCRSDAAALRFHLRPRKSGQPMMLVVIGGTGTGKSTVVNRMLGVDATATSFRRTFTAGAVAIARDKGDVPTEWLDVEHVVFGADMLPARGQNRKLVIVPGEALGERRADRDLMLAAATLVDTPDLDGDQPAHHAEADRAFRWAQALLFLVTPEKYQMTELLPYYRRARRYQVPTLFVMNKCEEQAVVEDYRTQLAAMIKDNPSPAQNGDVASDDQPPHVFTIPRDDANYNPPIEENLPALRDRIFHVAEQRPVLGASARAADLIGRFDDQILTPLRQERQEATRLISALHDMESPVPGIDVNPVTQDLERRLQQRSVLYLMGPQRVLDRVRQAPAFIVRLPRAAWDYVMRGEFSPGLFGDGGAAREVPDFKAVLNDQFSVLQSRIDDLLRASPVAMKWMLALGDAYASARIGADAAGQIADEELAELRGWLEKRWNATPRDTKALQSLLKYLPGGNKLTALAESAPYLLVLALIAGHAMFGMDLLVIGGYTVATWLTERLSNEVASRTRSTNSRIADRFTRLAHEQIQKMCDWINQQAAAPKTIDQLEKAMSDVASAAGLTSAELAG